MTLVEMIEKLEGAGYVVTWNDSHDTIFVNLYSRKPSMLEVVTSLGFQPRWIISQQDCVVIQE